MSYLLGTTARIAIINGRPGPVRERLRDALRQNRRVCVSSVAVFELWYRVAKSQRVAANRECLSVFMAKLEGLPFDDQDAELAGAIRARCERAGKPIGAYAAPDGPAGAAPGNDIGDGKPRQLRSRGRTALGKLGGRLTLPLARGAEM
jgi:tRNA(fMet)-specific endonuclease VapC